jgi:hypothetical protein
LPREPFVMSRLKEQSMIHIELEASGKVTGNRSFHFCPACPNPHA